MFDFALYACAESFHMMRIDVPTGVGAPPLSTQVITTFTANEYLINCNEYSATHLNKTQPHSQTLPAIEGESLERA